MSPNHEDIWTKYLMNWYFSVNVWFFLQIKYFHLHDWVCSCDWYWTILCIHHVLPNLYHMCICTGLKLLINCISFLIYIKVHHVQSFWLLTVHCPGIWHITWLHVQRSQDRADIKRMNTRLALFGRVWFVRPKLRKYLTICWNKEANR